MWWYVAIAAGCAALVPWARKRSEGSMVRYSVGTGAPVVFVLIGIAAVAAAVAQGSGDGELAREIFTGGLIGGAFAQFVLMRRTYGLSLGRRAARESREAHASSESGLAEGRGTPDPDEP